MCSGKSESMMRCANKNKSYNKRMKHPNMKKNGYKGSRTPGLTYAIPYCCSCGLETWFGPALRSTWVDSNPLKDGRMSVLKETLRVKGKWAGTRGWLQDWSKAWKIWSHWVRIQMKAERCILTSSITREPWIIGRGRRNVFGEVSELTLFTAYRREAMEPHKSGQ
jgi:hypothetical protein